MTTSGHTVTMDHVSVADLKAHLSHYLREVRGGASFVVTSRDMPVAVLGPYYAEDIEADLDDLVIIEPDPDAPPLSSPVVGHPAPVDIDAVKLIREDRDGRDQSLEDIVLKALGRQNDVDRAPGTDS